LVMCIVVVKHAYCMRVDCDPGCMLERIEKMDMIFPNNLSSAYEPICENVGAVSGQSPSLSIRVRCR